MKNSKDYQEAKRTAIDKAAGATPLSDIFGAGFDFAMSLPKQLSAYTFKPGELAAYKGATYEVVNFTRCEDCDLCTDGSCGLPDEVECPSYDIMFKKVE